MLKPPHPGEVFRNHFVPSSVHIKAELQQQLGASCVRELMEERHAVTTEIAVRLADAFKNSAFYWLRLQKTYDERMAQCSKTE